MKFKIKKIKDDKEEEEKKRLEAKIKEENEKKNQTDIAKFMENLEAKEAFNKGQKGDRQQVNIEQEDYKKEVGLAYKTFENKLSQKKSLLSMNEKPKKYEGMVRNYKCLIKALNTHHFEQFRHQFTNFCTQIYKEKGELDFNEKLLSSFADRNDEYRPQTALGLSSKKRANNRTENEKLLNPDEFFKNIICKTLKIPQEKVTSNYFKEFILKQNDEFVKIMDQKEKKEIKFHKTLLKLKKKEPVFPSILKDNYQELVRSTVSEVAFKVRKLESNIKKEKDKSLKKSVTFKKAGTVFGSRPGTAKQISLFSLSKPTDMIAKSPSMIDKKSIAESKNVI